MTEESFQPTPSANPEVQQVEITKADLVAGVLTVIDESMNVSEQDLGEGAIGRTASPDVVTGREFVSEAPGPKGSHEYSLFTVIDGDGKEAISFKWSDRDDDAGTVTRVVAGADSTTTVMEQEDYKQAADLIALQRGKNLDRKTPDYPAEPVFAESISAPAPRKSRMGRYAGKLLHSRKS